MTTEENDDEEPPTGLPMELTGACKEVAGVHAGRPRGHCRYGCLTRQQPGQHDMT